MVSICPSTFSQKSYAREFYEIESLRGGWSVRQLDRQINSQFYERTTLTKDKVAMHKMGRLIKNDDTLMPEAAIKDRMFLNFLISKTNILKVILKKP